MKKELLLLQLLMAVILSTQLFSALRIEGTPGYILAYQSEKKAFCPGFNLPFRVKYSEIDSPIALAISLQYTFVYNRYSYLFTWLDPLTSLDSSHSINAQDYYHIAILGTGFEYNLPLNWQKNDTKGLKYFYPYIGFDMNFYFLGIYRKTDLKEGIIPDYLFQEYKTHFQKLIPTIGATARAGTRIKISRKDFMNIMVQYAVLIPEKTTSKLYVNHLIQFNIGYETRMSLSMFASTSPEQKKK